MHSRERSAITSGIDPASRTHEPARVNGVITHQHVGECGRGTAFHVKPGTPKIIRITTNSIFTDGNISEITCPCAEVNASSKIVAARAGAVEFHRAVVHREVPFAVDPTTKTVIGAGDKIISHYGIAYPKRHGSVYINSTTESISPAVTRIIADHDPIQYRTVP